MAEAVVRLLLDHAEARAFVDPARGEQYGIRPQCDFAVARLTGEA
jgi:hypothetical protein